MHFTEFHTRVAAYAVIIDADRILLSWYNGGPHGHGRPGWSLPGGGVEYDESVEQAIVREAMEETGYRIRLGDPLTTNSFTDQAGSPADPGGKPYKSVRILYTASVVDGKLGTIEVGGTTDRAAWIDLDRVPTESRADIVDIGIASWRSHQLSVPGDPIAS
ncbi:NUDIX hydrolase [Microlunatus soli]|uniref:ADP-ribose pyrophosphatase YjhB, NUDIX family n=1 Tax=Microlunatus soli TaxID=630515 RepID=A0A1H1MQK9_9ACTN|nr:NUDIX domain-containing protein [Microlunatus soli]SDR88890.1 ADP-ribose pyrophosphatase YjhB, NUDIX family [Microlunatus soli]